MNKAYKVVFNKVRGVMMVVNELTKSLRKKGTKTVVAMTVGGVLTSISATALAADPSGLSSEENAKPITVTNAHWTNDTVPSFVFGQGKKVVVQSTNNIGVINTLQQARSQEGLLSRVRALTQVEGTHVGVGGGYFAYDEQGIGGVISQVGAKKVTYPFANVNQANASFAPTETDVQIGGEGAEPFIVGLAGGDVVLSFDSGKTDSLSLTRTTGTSATLLSGNTLGAAGGSVVIALEREGAVKAGSSVLEVNGHANLGLATSAGVAISLNKLSTSTVGSSQLTVNTHHDDDNAVSGVLAGVAGGGVALALGGGSAESKVTGPTTVDLLNGHALLIAGGGVAGATSKSIIESNSHVSTATATSSDVTINVGAETTPTDSLSVYGLIGGGIAASRQADGAAADEVQVTTEAKVGDITINLQNTSAAPLSGPQKAAVIADFRKVYDNLQNNAPLTDIALGAINDLSKGGLATNGVTVGVLGGGLAAAYESGHPSSTTTATTSASSTQINVSGGYNVALIGGGAALASGSGSTKALSEITGTSAIRVTGGETIGIIGGGIAGFTGTGETHRGVAAESSVQTSTITVEGGKVDGIIGGGLAWDDSNAKATNVSSKVVNSSIEVGSGGQIFEVNVGAIGIQNIDNVSALPGMREVLKESLHASRDAHVAILAGGVSAGANPAGIGTSVEGSTITINGSVQGNIFGGGMGIIGGKSSVEKSNITIEADGRVDGNVYAGGIARDNSAFDRWYRTSTSSVTESHITVKAGAQVKEVHTGGLTYGDSAVSCVKQAEVILSGKGSFAGIKFMNDGIKNGSTPTDATLTFSGVNDELTGQISGFQTLNVNSGSVTLASIDEAVKQIKGESGTSVKIKTLGLDAGRGLELLGSTLTADRISTSTGSHLTLNGTSAKLDLSGMSASGLNLADGSIRLSSGTLNVDASQLSEASTTGSASDYDKDFGSTINKAFAIEKGNLDVQTGETGYTLSYADALTKLDSLSGAKVTFFGSLVKETGESSNSITGSDLGNLPDNAVLGDVTLKAEDNLHTVIVGGGSGAPVSGTATTVGNLGLATLDFTQFANSAATGDVTIKTTAGKELSLVGDGNDFILSGDRNVSLIIDSGTITLGHSSAQEGTGGTLKTDEVQITSSGSQLNLTNASLETKSITINASVSDATITVGNNAGKGSLVVTDSATLNGALIFLDPVWTGTPTLAEASSYLTAVGTLDGKVVVGRNSYAAFGTTDAEKVQAALSESRLSWGPDSVTALAYIGTPLTIQSGALVVDGSLTSAPVASSVTNTKFANGSLLIVDAASVGNQTAITGAGSVTFGETAKLYLAGLTADQTSVTIFDSNAGDFWSDNNLVASNVLFRLSGSGNTTVNVELQSASDVFGNLMQANAIADAGMRVNDSYVTALLENSVLDPRSAAAQFDAAMNPMGALGTYTTAYDRATELREAVRDEAGSTTDPRLWVRMTGGKTKLDGISTGAQSLNLTTESFGVIVGGETSVSETTFGAAFAAGTGSTRNHNVSGKDSFNSYGLTGYIQREVGGVTLTADASATWISSELSIGGVADVSEDADTTVYSLGAEVKKSYDLSALTVSPFVGLDIYQVRSDSLTTKHGVRINDAKATAFEIPIGARAAMDFTTADGTNVKPSFSLAVVPTLGSKDIDVTSAFAGARSTMNFTFTDDVKVRSNLGITAEKKNVRFGLDLGYSWGNEERSAISANIKASYLF